MLEIPSRHPNYLTRKVLNSFDQLVLWIKRKGFENIGWDHEIYNYDKSRKFTFLNSGGAVPERWRMVGLMSRIGRGWCDLLSVREYWENRPGYYIEISSLQERGEGQPAYPIYYYDQRTSGKKQMSPYTAFDTQYEIYKEKIKRDIPISGIRKELDLPKFIDFEKTASTFLQQVKKLDFSNPLLFPKELVEDNDQKVLEK